MRNTLVALLTSLMPLASLAAALVKATTEAGSPSAVGK